MTSRHQPETNGKIEHLNQTIVRRLKCKVNNSSSKISWPKVLNEVLNQFDSMSHSVTISLTSYLLLEHLLYHP